MPTRRTTAIVFSRIRHGVYQAAGKAANHPVQTVNWYDWVKWSNARSEQAGLTPVYYTDAGLTQVYTNGEPTTLYPNWAANGYRLPTEAEWEKAARGGLSGQRFPWGDMISQKARPTTMATDLAAAIPTIWDRTATTPIATTGGSPYTSPVGSFAANGYGLYDMAGNVFEWCWDWYGTPYGQPTYEQPNRTSRTVELPCVARRQFGTPSPATRGAPIATATTPTYAHVNFGFRCVRGL